MIPLCEPCFGGDEGHFLEECLHSTFVSSVGPFVERFERAFARAVGSPYAVACASGTAAIHLALRALGVEQRDLVLCSDFTFIASANPIAYQGATPVFIDSEPRTWNMDPALLAQALDELASAGLRPKAVVLVHIYGQPADLGPILEVAAHHGVPVVEDAAESLGGGYTADYPYSSCRGRQVGTCGLVGCFSFNGNKVITSGGGGMVVTADERLARRVRHLSTQAKLSGAGYVHDEVGYNYRLPNLNAAFGLAQLGHLDSYLSRKRALAGIYRSALAGRVAFQEEIPGTRSSAWMNVVALPGGCDAAVVTAQLSNAGVGCRPAWLPVSRQGPYTGARCFGRTVAPRLAASGICLPSSVGLTDEDCRRAAAVLTAILDPIGGPR